MEDRYGTDVLAAGWRDRHRRELARVPAERDTVIEVAEDGFCGAVTSCAGGLVELEDRKGRRRTFSLGLKDGSVRTLNFGFYVTPGAPPPASKIGRAQAASVIPD